MLFFLKTFIRSLVILISLLVATTVVAANGHVGGIYNRPPVYEAVEVGYAPQALIAMEQYAEHRLRDHFPPQDRANPIGGMFKTHSHSDSESESSSSKEEDSSSEESGSFSNQSRIYSGMFITISFAVLNAI